MKRAAILAIFILGLLPYGVKAQVFSCSEQGYTIVFVNGIFGDKEKAKADARHLQDTLGYKFNSESVRVYVGYNPTHLAGAADVAQATAQMFSGNISNFDRDTILLQIHPEVTTRKLILVGHSQGAFYSNEMYSYLLEHGEPIEALSVYNVGSPASYTAGSNSAYLNSSGDLLLQSLRTANFKILPNNVDIAVDTSPNGWQGHGFSDTYLAGASERMVDDLHAQMQDLEPIFSSNTSSCFTPPKRSVGYVTQSVVLAVADPTAIALKVGVGATMQGATALLNGASTLAFAIGEFISDAIMVTTTPRDEKKDAQKTFEVTKKLYGSSLSADDYKELVGDSQGGAALLALPKEEPVAINGGFVEGTSTGPVIESATTSAPLFVPAPSTPTQEWMVPSAPAPTPEPEVSTTTVEEIPEETVPALPAAPTPPAIVINEIQWAGDAVSPEREWIELKNLSNESVDLSNLAIAATEGGSQYIPLTGIIAPLGFFIVQRDTAAPLNPAANASFDFSSILQIIPFEALNDMGEQLALVEVGDWGTTTVDMTPSVSSCGGWCAGTASGSGLNATLSMERISPTVSGENASNWESNDTYTTSGNMPGGNGRPLYATVSAENSKHISQDFGWFCSPDTTPISIGQTYHPQTSSCTYLTRFIAWPSPVFTGIFKGTFGSSTLVSVHGGGAGTLFQYSDTIDPNDTQSGDEFFAAIWSPRTGLYPDPMDNQSFRSYFTTGHPLVRDGFNGPLIVSEDTNPPTENYRVVPFVYTP